MEKKEEEKKEEVPQKKEETTESKEEPKEKEEQHAKKILSSTYYEYLRNIMFYFINNSEKSLQNPIKAEDIEMEVEFKENGSRNCKFYNRGKKEDYSKNQPNDYKKLKDDFTKLAEIYKEEKMSFSAKDLRLEPNPTKGNFMNFDEIFTIDEEGKQIKFPAPKLQSGQNTLIFCTYLKKIKEQSINYLKDVNLKKNKDKYQNIFFLFLVPMKMKDKLKEAKTKAEDIIRKLSNFGELGDSFQIIYSLYPKGYDKYKQ
mgnify:CR=1 FL=1